MEKTDISYKAKPSLNPFRCTPIEETSSIFINSLISSDYNDFVVDSVSINNDTLRKNFLYQVRTRAGDLIQWEETLPKSINLSNNILYLKTEIISTLSEYNLEITYHTNYGDLTKTHEAFKSRPPKLTVSAGGSYFDTQVGIIDTIKKVGIRLCGDSEYILKDWEIIGEWTKDSIWFEREHSVNFRFIKNFGYNVGEILLSPKEDGFKKGRIILTFLDLETNEEYKVYSNIRSFVDPVLSAEQDEINQQFNLYPNPSNGVFSVKTDNNIYNLSVYNSNGVRVYNQFPYSGEKINFENISNGLYLIQLKNAIKTINKKLIIRK